jgi:hypothetical protein
MAGFPTVICGLCERPARLNFGQPVSALRHLPRAAAWADLRDTQLICADCIAALIANPNPPHEGGNTQ